MGLVTVVGDDDFQLVSKHKWHAVKHGRTPSLKSAGSEKRSASAPSKSARSEKLTWRTGQKSIVKLWPT